MAVALFQQAYHQAEQIGCAIKEKPKDLFKTLKYGTQAVQLSSAAMSLDPTLAAANHAFCLATTVFAFKICTTELLTLPEKAFTFLTNINYDTASKFAMGIGDSLTTGYDYVDWARLSDVATLVMPFWLSVSIAAALVLTSGKRVYDIGCKLADDAHFDRHVEKLNIELSGTELAVGEIRPETAKYHLLADLAKNVAFAAIGAFLLLSSYGIFSLSAPAMLAIKVISLVASIIKTYQATDITLNADIGPSYHNQFIAQLA